MSHTLAREADVITSSAASIHPDQLSTFTERGKLCVLFVTTNVTVRELGSAAQKKLVGLGNAFAEIHVLILNEFSEETVSSVRLTDNVWLYSTDSSSWWKTIWDGYRTVNEQLVFKGTFRPDLIIAQEPYEAGAVGYLLAEKYDRPLQVQVLEDTYSSHEHAHAFIRDWIARQVLPHADSLRTNSHLIREKLVQDYPELEEHIEVLPMHYSLHTWKNTPPSFSLCDRYPQFSFFMLHVSHMQASSHTGEVINGVAPLLRKNPALGLIIVGNGPYRPALEKQVIALGIHAQVEFEPVPDEIISHMKSAHVLIHFSENSSEDITVLQAATVGLPIIATKNTVAGALFKDAESALLCTRPDPGELSAKLKLFIQNNNLRTIMKLRAEEIVNDRVQENYTEYLRAYRGSIERCVYGGTQVA